MFSVCKIDRKYRNYSFLLIFLMFIELVFYFYIKPIQMYWFISQLKYITTSVSTRKETLMGIIYILIFSLFYSIAIISYKVIFENERYSIKEVLRKSILNLTVFLSVKLFLLLTIDTIYSFLRFRVISYIRAISYSGYLGYSIAVVLYIVFYITSFSLLVLISLNLLNSGKKYLNTKYSFSEIKTFVFSKTLLEILLLSLILNIPYMIYHTFFFRPDILGLLNYDNPSILGFMKTLHIYEKIDPLHLVLRFSGRALTCFFIFIKVFKFVDKTQEME